MVAPITDDELLADIRRVHNKLGAPPSENDYREHGEYSVSAVRRAFGKFTEGRKKAGIPNPDMRGGHNRISHQELINELQRVGDELEKTPTREEMVEHGDYAEGPYRREFGSWSEALLAAGYDYDELNRPGSHVAEYVWVKCTVCGEERRRLKSQIEECRNVFCSQDCLHLWRSEEFTGESHPLTERIEIECEHCGDTKEVIPAVAKTRTYHFCNYDCMGKWRSENRSGENAPAWQGGKERYYGPNWLTQRKKALQRDDYQCRQCGCTEKEHFEKYDRQLSVHHWKTISEFYEESNEGFPDFEQVNALYNLITLCIACHRKIEEMPIAPQIQE